MGSIADAALPLHAEAVGAIGLSANEGASAALLVDGGADIRLDVEAGGRTALMAGEVVEHVPDPYAGPYSVEPSAGGLRLATRGKTLSADVVVQPIPSNYGLVTWDGSTITVS